MLRRLRAPHSGTRSREGGRCCAAAAAAAAATRGSEQPAPARRPAPHAAAPRPASASTARPARDPRLPPPASGPEDVRRPGDVSASGVAWLPRRFPRPAASGLPGATLTQSPPRGLGYDMAAGIPPSRHTPLPLLDAHPFLPAKHDVCRSPSTSPLWSSCSPTRQEKMETGWDRVRQAPKVVPSGNKRQDADVSEVTTSTETQ